MNKVELINLVKKIQSAQDSEKDIDKLIDLFLDNVSDPNAADYFYKIEYENLSAAEIVIKAQTYIPKLQ